VSSVPAHFRGVARWVSDNIVSSVLLLPNGDVVLKQNGNNSGSPTTTGDNIIAHILILSTLLLYHFNTIDALDFTVARIFGDDNVLSLPDTQGFEQSAHEVFSWFGLVLKPYKQSYDLHDMEFLGFKFFLTDMGWVPAYNPGRLVASYCYNIKKGPMSSSISRMFILTIMLAPYPEIFELCSEGFIDACYKLRYDKDPTVKSFCAMGVPSRAQCLSFMLGLEQSVGGGINKIIEELCPELREEIR
jgi:hypothetical protein